MRGERGAECLEKELSSRKFGGGGRTGGSSVKRDARGKKRVRWRHQDGDAATNGGVQKKAPANFSIPKLVERGKRATSRDELVFSQSHTTAS